MLELAIAAASDPALAARHSPIVIQARRRLNRIWLDSLAAAGFPRARAERFILLTHYLLRGVFVVSTWLPYKTNRRAVTRAWSELAPALLEARRPSRRRRAKAPPRHKRAAPPR